MDWLIDWCMDGLIDWLMDWSIDGLIDRSIDWCYFLWLWHRVSKKTIFLYSKPVLDPLWPHHPTRAIPMATPATETAAFRPRPATSSTPRSQSSPTVFTLPARTALPIPGTIFSPSPSTANWFTIVFSMISDRSTSPRSTGTAKRWSSSCRVVRRSVCTIPATRMTGNSSTPLGWSARMPWSSWTGRRMRFCRDWSRRGCGRWCRFAMRPAARPRINCRFAIVWSRFAGPSSWDFSFMMRSIWRSMSITSGWRMATSTGWVESVVSKILFIKYHLLWFNFWVLGLNFESVEYVYSTRPENVINYSSEIWGTIPVLIRDLYVVKKICSPPPPPNPYALNFRKFL